MRGSRAGEREGGRGKGDADAYQGDGELSGREERERGDESEREREPGLGEILRGLRAMARVKRARV